MTIDAIYTSQNSRGGGTGGGGGRPPLQYIVGRRPPKRSSYYVCRPVCRGSSGGFGRTPLFAGIPLITVRKLREASLHARRILHGPVHDAQRGYADYRSVLGSMNCEGWPVPQGRAGRPWPPQFLAPSPKITISPSVVGTSNSSIHSVS